MRSLLRIPESWPSLVIVLLSVVVWELSARLGYVSTVTFAVPSDIATTFWKMAGGELWGHAAISLYRLFVGFVIGAVLGILAGMATGWFVFARRSLEPIINALYGLPKIAILPLLILILGIGEAPKVTVIVIGTFFPIWINTHAGMRNVDRLLVRVIRSFGADERQVLFKVALPHIVPYLVAGTRLAMGHSLVLIIAAELLAAKSGLGFLIWQAAESYHMEKLLGLIFLFGFMSLVLLKFFLYMEKRVTPWRAE